MTLPSEHAPTPAELRCVETYRLRCLRVMPDIFEEEDRIDPQGNLVPRPSHEGAYHFQMACAYVFGTAGALIHLFGVLAFILCLYPPWAFSVLQGFGVEDASGLHDWFSSYMPAVWFFTVVAGVMVVMGAAYVGSVFFFTVPKANRLLRDMLDDALYAPVRLAERGTDTPIHYVTTYLRLAVRSVRLTRFEPNVQEDIFFAMRVTIDGFRCRLDDGSRDPHLRIRVGPSAPTGVALTKALCLGLPSLQPSEEDLVYEFVTRYGFPFPAGHGKESAYATGEEAWDCFCKYYTNVERILGVPTGAFWFSRKADSYDLSKYNAELAGPRLHGILMQALQWYHQSDGKVRESLLSNMRRDLQSYTHDVAIRGEDPDASDSHINQFLYRMPVGSLFWWYGRLAQIVGLLAQLGRGGFGRIGDR